MQNKNKPNTCWVMYETETETEINTPNRIQGEAMRK